MSDEHVVERRHKPGSFGCHEAMHMASVFRDMIEDHLVCHTAIMMQPEWLAMAEEACDALFRLYQAIGAKHMDAPFSQ